LQIAAVALQGVLAETVVQPEVFEQFVDEFVHIQITPKPYAEAV
jgi:hypothetical protein